MNITQGCSGSCNQGRTSCDCMRWDGTSRDTQPGELLPNTPDPAVGSDSGWWVAGIMLTAFVAALWLAQWATA